MAYYSVRFKAGSNGQYLCAEGGGGMEVVANRATPSTWETFKLTDVDGGPLTADNPVLIRSFNGMYLCAENGGGREVNASRTVASLWETFTIVHADGSPGPINNGDKVGFKVFNGQYVAATPGGAVVANWNAIGGWETFDLEIIEQNQLTI